MSKRANLLKELRSLSEADLHRRLIELRENLRELSFKTRGDEIRDVHKFAKAKNEIATVLTIINEKRKIMAASPKSKR